MAFTNSSERLKTLFLTRLCPPLAGQPLSEWLRVMWANRFDVDSIYWPRTLINLPCSLLTSVMQQWEAWKFRSARDVPVPPPVFVLGHYRSGTTLLHNLLAVDKRFAFPTMFRIYNPYTFRVFEPLGSRLAAAVLPRRRIVDSMEWGVDMPQEDEMALMMMTGMSPYMGFVFSRRWEQFQRYSTFRDVPSADVRSWQLAFLWYVKKLTQVDGRPLLLKSPPHIARIGLLLDMFPNARFVHIHREPYTVFRSTRQLFERVTEMVGLQRPARTLIDGRVLRHYRDMYDAFFEQRSLIPSGQFSEVRFDALESEPVREIERVYAELNLPDFSAVRLALEQYVNLIKGHRKNEYPPLPEEQRRIVSETWRRNFDEWNYRV